MKIFILIVSFVILAGGTKLNAQFVYPNDVCSGAMPIPVSNNGQLSDSAFQRNQYADPAVSPIPDCAGATASTRYDLWYSFTAADTSIGVVLENLSSNGVFYQIFSGSCGSLTSIYCSINGVAPPVNIGGLVPGQTYYLRTYFPGIINSRSVASNYKLSLLSKPINDDCGGAALLPVNPVNASAFASSRFSNALATAAADVSCASNQGWAGFKDVWFKFIATSTVHTIIMSATKSGTRMVIYGGNMGSLTAMATYQSSLGILSRTETLTNLTLGETYYIRAGANAVVNFNLGIFQGSPQNDECINADTVLMSNSFTCENNFVVKRLGATNSTTVCPSISDKDVWYIFKATATDITATISGDGASSLKLGLLSGNCGALTCLASTSNSLLNVSGLVVGNYYYLKAGGNRSELLAFVCIAPKITNDECGNAIILPVKPFNQLRTNIGYNKTATQSIPACTGSSEIADVWYRFTATDTACLITTDGEIAGQVLIEVLTGGCNTLTSIYCSPNTFQPANMTERTARISGLLPGNNYYVRCYTAPSESGLFTIDINSLPANDTCSAAVTLIPQQGLAYQVLADNGIRQASTSKPACSTAVVTNDIWYKFTATQNSMAIISNLENSGTVLGLQVYSGTCGALTSLDCIQQGTAKHKAQTFTNLVPGQTYFIRQYGNVYNNKLTIIEQPLNDEMAGAIKLSPAPANVQTLPSYYLHGASKQFGKICSSGNYTIHHDVWFYFIAEAASHSISTSASNSFWEEQLPGYTYRIETFRGFAADSTSLVAKAMMCGAGSLALNGLTAGDTVYVRIANTSAAGNTSIFNIKIGSTQNIDEPGDALVLNETDNYQYLLNTTGATQSLPASGCVIADFPDDDIWLKFTASATAKRIIAGFETRDISLQLFSGTPGNLTSILCSNNIMVLPAGLSNGAVYFVRAYSKANALSASFNIGLFGEDDPLANGCVAGAVLGPNLVLNPRCESEYKYLLPKNDDGTIVAGRKIADGWWSSTYATADMWNADYPLGEWGNLPGKIHNSRDKIPRSGKGMFGILSNLSGSVWTEYVTGKLVQPLTTGKTYQVSFYVSIAKEALAKHLFNIGAYLSNDSIVSNSSYAIEIQPDIANPPGQPVTEENNWVKICGTFYADKPYSFITIGNFGAHAIYSSSVGSYFFIDDVVVAEVTSQVLPLNLLNFNGRTNARNETELSWQTADETNTKNFLVEWRTGSTNFNSIGTVPAKGNTYNAYNFLHSTPADGYNYYRLKMVDVDGRFTYSSTVRTGNNFKNNHIVVYPNPVSAALNITAQADKEELVFFRLMNVEGKVVATKSLLLRKGSNTFTWNIVQLKAGNYFITSTNKRFGAIQIIKQ